MTPRLLVSVRSASEAKICVTARVDIIDVKEPHNGGLGNAGVQVWREIAAVVPPETTSSVAMGELCERSPEISADEMNALREYNFAKVGLANAAGSWRQDWLRWRQSLPHNVQPVAVAYADWKTCNAPSPEEILQHTTKWAPVFLIDTFDKSNGQVNFASDELGSIVERCHKAGSQFAIAGGLQLETIGSAIEYLNPDIVAVRGAACDGDRNSDITSNAAIMQLKAVIGS